MKIDLNSGEIAIIISISGVAISFSSVLISFFNVNRQRKASKTNEEEKFKREINLKTYEELVEHLFDFLNVIQKYRALKGRHESIVKNSSQEQIDKLNELTWEITENWFRTIITIRSYFIKKRIILKNFEVNFESINRFSESLDNKLWRYKSAIWDQDKETMETLVTSMSTRAEELIELVTNTIYELQEKFLGSIFVK